MNYESLDILIWCHFSKFFSTSELYLSNSWQSIFGYIGPLGKLFVYKLYIRIAESKKRYSKHHFDADIGQ